MNLTIRYAALLSLLLVAMFVLGNPSFSAPHNHNSTLNEIPNPFRMYSTLYSFPYVLLAVFSIFLVIAGFILHVSRLTVTGFTWQIGVRSGELASRWAAAFYAFSTIMYAIGFYEGRLDTPVHYYYFLMALFGGITCFVGTYLVGLASAALAAIVVIRTKKGAAVH